MGGEQTKFVERITGNRQRLTMKNYNTYLAVHMRSGESRWIIADRRYRSDNIWIAPITFHVIDPYRALREQVVQTPAEMANLIAE